MAKQKNEKKAKGGAASKALTAGGEVALALAVGVTGAGNFFSGVPSPDCVCLMQTSGRKPNRKSCCLR